MTCEECKENRIRYLKEENKRLADQVRSLKESFVLYEHINWNPYPQVKPRWMKMYLVTLTEGKVTMQPWHEVISKDLDLKVWENVIAWAELPRPYEGNSSIKRNWNGNQG